MIPTQVAGSPWAVPAVHDTVAAIARQGAYQRSELRGLWDSLLRMLERALDLLRDAAGDSPLTRRAMIVLLVVLGAIEVARIVVLLQAARRPGGGVSGRVPLAPDPLVEARRLASAGRHTEAAHALFVALLERLAARGEVRLHPSKTSGDYARELARRDSPDRERFQAFRLRYDRIVYGAGRCEAAEFEELMGRAEPLLRSRSG